MTKTLIVTFFSILAVGLVLWLTGYFKPNSRIWTDGEKLEFFVAVETGDLEFIRGQLIAGFNPNIKNSKNLYTLCVAAQTGNLPMVKLLIEAGADEKLRSQGYGAAIHCAAQSGKSKVVDFISKFQKKKVPKLDCRYPYCRRDIN